MMKRRLSLLFAMLMAAALCFGCGSSETETEAATEAAAEAESTAEAEAAAETEADNSEKLNTTLYVGCSVRTMTNPYMVTIAEGCEMFCDYLDSIGQKYEYELMTNEGSNDEQINQISAFLAKANGNAILFCDPNEAAVCGTIAELVSDAGAYMCTTWNKPDDIDVWDYSGWVAHHSPDDVQMGYEIAVEMFSQFETPYEGKIVAVQGLLGNTTNTNRYAGLQKALEEYPDVELVATEAADWSADAALELMETWNAAYTDLDGVWCANDNMAIGVVRALEAVGKAGQVKVVGINAIESALDYIEQGYMTASADCQGWQQGAYTLAICYDCWLGNTKVEDLDHDHRLFGTAFTLVTQDNVKEFKDKYYSGKDLGLDYENYWDAFRTGDYPV